MQEKYIENSKSGVSDEKWMSPTVHCSESEVVGEGQPQSQDRGDETEKTSCPATPTSQDAR